MSHINPYTATHETIDDPFNDLALASRLQRFLAVFIDFLIQLMTAIPMSFILFFVIGLEFGNALLGQVIYSVVQGLVSVAFFLLINGYFLATQGKTIGKLILGIRIVHRHTNQLLPLGELIFKRYSWQWIIAMFPGLNLFLIINALLIFRQSRACLHDDIATTKVING